MSSTQTQQSYEQNITDTVEGQHDIFDPSNDQNLSAIDQTSDANDHERSNSTPDQIQPSANTTGPTRIPGTYPPEWLPDQETDSCMSCNNAFTLIKRRHHCRSCGKIFCGDCCRHKAKLLYLDNKEARVCTNCFYLIECMLLNTEITSNPSQGGNCSSRDNSMLQVQSRVSPRTRVQGVLKSCARTKSKDCTTSTSTSGSSSSDQQSNKQVVFSDGIRPGTDLSESFPCQTSSSSAIPSSSSFSMLSRQSEGSSKKNRSNRSQDSSSKNITVCDELGYLPPIVISKNHNIARKCEMSFPNSLTNLITSQFRSSGTKKMIRTSMESRSCPLNGVMKFEEMSQLVGSDGVITFLLLKDFYLKVKLIKDGSSVDKIRQLRLNDELEQNSETINQQDSSKQKDEIEYWCFSSDGLAKFGQNEIVLVIDKEEGNSCIPRDVFKIYLTLHELGLRRQSLENMGNLLFQDGLFGNRDTAGLLFVRLLEEHRLHNLVIPDKPFLVAIVLQRWEVPWAKVFPMRLLLRLGHKFGVYPYPIFSLRARDPVYYEVGDTIISILGDFRNFRYSITHVDGMKVMLNKTSRKVMVKLNQSHYQQFNKVLDSSNNEHVLAWSSCPFPESHGHLVSVQNEDGRYETVEFYKKSNNKDVPESGTILGASFVIFSGAMKVNQTGQSAKISIVEDGLLIQIQSCTMSALKNAIHFMHHFDIDCENNQDPLNRVEIDWQLEDI